MLTSHPRGTGKVPNRAPLLLLLLSDNAPGMLKGLGPASWETRRGVQAASCNLAQSWLLQAVGKELADEKISVSLPFNKYILK